MRQISKKIILAVLLSVCLSVAASAALPATLIPGGNTIGLQLQSDGVSIVEFTGDNPTAKAAGLRRGDRIHAVDGKDIWSAQQLSEAVQEHGGTPMTLTVERDGALRSVTIAPQQTEDGWRLGMYVRDSITGIGTVTYYEAETGRFGALGHGVNDGSSETLLPIRSGTVLPSQVVAVTKGKAGDPGALQGALRSRSTLGVIEKNTAYGIFGTVQQIGTRKAVPVASGSEVHVGAATILSNVDGTAVREYSIRICAVDHNQAQGRNLLLEVTDGTLLKQTGGIVQGMSGSPILQDGKLVGAVTHVLVNNPVQGYGICIENMLDAAA